MASLKYKRIDTLIVNKIGGHPQRFAGIFLGEIKEECERIVASYGENRGPDRVLDSRLQALRKAGKIKATPKGWVWVEKAK